MRWNPVRVSGLSANHPNGYDLVKSLDLRDGFQLVVLVACDEMWLEGGDQPRLFEGSRNCWKTSYLTIL